MSPRRRSPGPARIMHLYKSGMTIKEVAAHLCIKTEKVAYALRRLGVPLRKWGPQKGKKYPKKSTLEKSDEIKSLYESGMTLTEVASHLHIGRGPIWNELRRLGVPLRKSGQQKSLMDDKLSLNVVRLYRSGMTIVEVAVHLHITPRIVSYKLCRLGIPRRKAVCRDQKGPKNSAWRGGLSREPYAWTFNAELKEEVRRRDGHKCQACSVSQVECETKLHVHHIDYCKRNSDPVNLISLCRSCHRRTNTNRKHWTAWFQRKMIRRAKKERWFFNG